MSRLIRILVSFVALLWCESGAGRIRAVRSGMPLPARILVVTAHPDDEILMAPFLAARCIRVGASCSILVLTRGEGGGDAAVRSREMARAADLLHLTLTQWSLPDTFDPAGWGDRAKLVQRISGVIASQRPEMILTFDPVHGSTGHPAHREVGALVLQTGARNVYLLETLARFEGDGFVLTKADGVAWEHDARSHWEYAVRDAEIHASQFTPPQIQSLRAIAPDQRRVWLRQAS